MSSDLETLLSTLRTTSIRFRAKSGPAVEAARSLADLYFGSDVETRVSIKTGLDQDLARKLVNVSGDLAERGANSGDEAWLTAAFVCNALAAGKEDEREQIRRLVLVAAAADHIGVDYRSLIRNVLTVADNDGIFVLGRFLNRARELNDLPSFEIEVRIKHGVLTFEPVKSPFGWPSA